MVFLLLVVLSVVFVELFMVLNIATDAQKVLKLSSDSFGVMRSKTMSDEEKEALQAKESRPEIQGTQISREAPQENEDNRSRQEDQVR